MLAAPNPSELRWISLLTELSETVRDKLRSAQRAASKHIPCRAGPMRGRHGAASVAPACLLHNSPHTEREPCGSGQAADVTETPDPKREREDQQQKRVKRGEKGVPAGGPVGGRKEIDVAELPADSVADSPRSIDRRCECTELTAGGGRERARSWPCWRKATEKRKQSWLRTDSILF